MKVVIVGGGTAGWLAASFFESHNKLFEEDEQFHLHYDVSVIESPNVPIIGAGEGSTGMFPDLVKKLSHIGINEIDFYYETESTIKLGINFKDWNGIGTSYFSPLGPTQTYNRNIDLELFSFALKNRAHDASLCGYLATRGMSQFRKNMAQQLEIHAYHFDAHKVGQYFKNKCVKTGTKNIIGHIVSVNKDESGNIKNIVLESGQIVEGDLFIDCSGFSRVLAKEMDMGWESYAEYLPVNAALPYIHQYQENEQVMPETLAWAQNNGWMWQIPTQTRYGCGYVYCDAFVNQENALKELEMTTGRKIEPIRNLKFETGRLKKFWKNNVVAMGLASSFLEPLQATSIHTTILQLQMLFNYIRPHETDTLNKFSEDYNNYLTNVVDEFKDLIQIHYMTNRQDTDFWKFMKYDLKKTEKTKFVLDMSQYRNLSFYDFSTQHGTASWGVWSWTLVGLGIISKKMMLRGLTKHGLYKMQDELVNIIDKQSEEQMKTLLTNKQFIDAVKNKNINAKNFAEGIQYISHFAKKLNGLDR